VDALCAQLRRWILDGVAAPGQPLREADVAAKFRVGRNTVRSALQTLAHEGLLHHEVNKGVSVKQYDLADVIDLYGMRAALEVETTRLIAAEQVDITGAEQALLDLEATSDDTAWSDLLILDMRFHQLMVHSVGNARIAQSFDSLTLEIRLLQAQVGSSYARPAALLGAQHRELLEAIRSGDVNTATAAMRSHLALSQREVTRALRHRARPECTFAHGREP
jgi:DNA-binding GntR family transcriptional regulator